MQSKKNSKKRETRKEILLDEFLRDDDGVFDDEDEDSVTDDTLEFLCLDDEMIESYCRGHRSSQTDKRSSSKRYEEVYEDDEDEDDEYEDEDYEDEDDEYEDEDYEDEDDEY
ncbi:MAG: hypothetical protein K2L82_18145, partial [Lachnospiraceae bacterium]|nr:hypothetical protein [Lachnospiraceae bacterium]